MANALIVNVSVFCSKDGGDSYINYGELVQGEGDYEIWRGSIPGQPAGTHLICTIDATNDLGYMGTESLQEIVWGSALDTGAQGELQEGAENTQGILVRKIYYPEHIFPVLCFSGRKLLENGLFKWEIENQGNTAKTIRVASEVLGWSYPEVTTITLQAGEAQAIPQFPSFKKEILENNELMVASIRFTVQNGNETIYDDTQKIEIYAADNMIWTLSQAFDAAPLIIAWVTPNDNDTIGGIIKIAKERMPDRALMGYLRKDKYDVLKEVGAIWYTLQEDMGISYVNSPITFAKGFAQKVKLPRTSIETKSANCIEGTVLMASVLENLGIETEIILVPGHAFLGFYLSPGGDKLFIETTFLGSTTTISNNSFKNAVEAGIEEYNKAIDEIKSAHITTGDLSKVMQSGYAIIPVKQMREDFGITPLPIK